jgi:hypothetical protein
MNMQLVSKETEAIIINRFSFRIKLNFACDSLGNLTHFQTFGDLKLYLI